MFFIVFTSITDHETEVPKIFELHLFPSCGLHRTASLNSRLLWRGRVGVEL
jgi:hypothetical protein